MGMPDSVLGDLSYGQPFRDMSEEDLAWLGSRLLKRSFAAGEVVIDVGGPASGLFFISRGSVLLEVEPGQCVVAELVTGECFPLEALTPGSVVSSRFRAGRDVLCQELCAADLFALSERSDVFREFCRKRAEATRAREKQRTAPTSTRWENLQDELNRPLSAIGRDPALTMKSDATLGQVLAEMQRQNGGRTCVIVNSINEMVGSFGLRDLLERVVRQPIDTSLRISAFMALPLPALPLDAPAYAAAALMAERGCSEVALLDHGKVAGIIDEQHLFEVASLNLGYLSRRLRVADTVGEWINVSRLIAHYARQLIEQGLAATRVTHLVSELSDQLAVRIIASEFSRLELPQGTRWAWLVFGSEGRHEQTLLTDQDNGLVFSVQKGGDLEAARAIFLAASKRINETLAECGQSLCSGGIMAGNPACCLSIDEWTQRFNNWISSPEPEAILNATIFFDFRFLTGHPELTTDLHAELKSQAPESRRFQLLLAGSALQRTPPIGFFRDFRTDDEGMIDLKLGAVAIFVDAARLYALANGSIECATDERFYALSAKGKLNNQEVIAWQKAFAFVQTLRLRVQVEALATGQPVSNRINPYALNELDRRFLLESLRQAAKIQKRMQMDFSQQ
jgi:CBS domain-containing protein